MKRVVKTPFEYAGKHHALGDKVDIELNDVLLLVRLGWIEPEAGEPGFVASSREKKLTVNVEEQAAKDMQQYDTREMTAATESNRPTLSLQQHRRSQYHRKEDK